VRMTKWSSILDQSTHKDSHKFHFAFCFGISYIFYEF
jgi:hypothetical protein